MIAWADLSWEDKWRQPYLAINQLKHCVFPLIALVGRREEIDLGLEFEYNNLVKFWVVLPSQPDWTDRFGVGKDGQLYQLGSQWQALDLIEQTSSFLAELCQATTAAFGTVPHSTIQYEVDIIVGESKRQYQQLQVLSKEVPA